MELRNITFAAILTGAWFFAAAGPAMAGQPSLELPIDCNPGKDCWIVNYVDHDPGKGVLDYNCGSASYNAQPGNRHKGVDIAIRDAVAMRRGVNVMAAAAGTVLGVRDGMMDIDVKKAGGAITVKGRECGNGVVISHADGWTTQYCHMRKGSVRVKRGEQVAAGQVIGMVGTSGLSQYPHLHFQVKKGKNIIDPFVGLKPKAICGPGETPLWKKDVMARLPYHPTAIYNVGFTDAVPKSPDKARQGMLSGPDLPAKSKAMILWADIFQVRKGDKLSLNIDGPGGAKILRYKTAIKKNRTRHFVYAGKPLKTSQWPPGAYRGEVTLIRKRGVQGPEKLTEVRTITIAGAQSKKKAGLGTEPAAPVSPSIPDRPVADKAPSTPMAAADQTNTTRPAAMDVADEELVSTAPDASQILWKPKNYKWRWVWLAIAVGGAVFIIIYNAVEERRQLNKITGLHDPANGENDVNEA